MGLFDVFKKKNTNTQPSVPEPVTCEPGAFELAAPVCGRLVKLAEVPDPVFSAEVLGKGCAVWPDDDVVYAPVSGTVTVVMGHAVGITNHEGVEVLVHIGIDTVSMNGDGFTGFVHQGDTVVAGQALIRMDRIKIEAAGHPDCVVMLVSNSANYADVALVANPETHVTAGTTVLSVYQNDIKDM
ncbi:PTS glucose transporter subunit IIA [Collinsella sp. zg1085]|uniref:PTS sugar transporter subunit IIA n=1 Tax=Collinsella sp. zg1085 TaxID=2844380 RepID=UPI001C0B30C7|nr:PTS glucose transporter subunit IIA [Collinsella sp. zg1085]QWT17391.1 PTS glucose transporter subunit IIA [Collinsella sp. zg1085]